MTRSSILLLTILFMITAWGCGTTSPAVATIGDESITLQEFERAYAKNNGGPDSAARSTQQQREDFLDLLVKFHLKVAEAKDRGIDKQPEIQSEILGYELSVAETYMIEKELIEPNIRTLYDKKKEELRCSHILLRLAPDASPEDTLKAYTKAMEIIRQIPAEDFDTLAVRYSEEPNAATTKGDLGYFSVGRMVPVFEDAAYALQEGEYSSVPLRTQFGYHIIKMRERHPNDGPLRISFIILYYAKSGDTLAVKDTAWSLYNRLRAGEDFATLASQYSHDEMTASRGGDVGYYEKERLPPPIAEVLTRTPTDSVSEPFFIPNGVYIFKVTDRQGIPPFDQEQQGLRQKYRQMRYEKDFADYVDALFRRYHLEFNIPVRYELEHSLADTTLTPADSGWNTLQNPALLSETLMSYDGGSLTVHDALDLVGFKPDFQMLVLTTKNVEQMIDNLATEVILREHARGASDFREDFRALMDEYRDGILLYQVEQEEVWNRVVVNDSLLRAFHEPRKDQYRMPDRVNVAEIYVTTDSLVQLAKSRISAGEDFPDIAETMTMRAGYREKKGVWGFQPVTTNDMTRRAAAMDVDSVSAPFRNGAGWSIIKVIEKDSARVKTFDEASLEVTSAYQEYAAREREKAWLGELRAKFGVTENRELLSNAFKRQGGDTP